MRDRFQHRLSPQLFSSGKYDSVYISNSIEHDHLSFKSQRRGRHTTLSKEKQHLTSCMSIKYYLYLFVQIKRKLTGRLLLQRIV